MDSNDKGAEKAESWIIPRPTSVLMNLPIEIRWEVTRRHPYYLRFWQLAQKYHRQPSDDEQERRFEESARLILLAIGVSGCPPEPTTTFQELDGEMLGEIWRDGAITPMTYRALIGTLLTGLPPNIARDLSGLFAFAAEVAGDRTAHLFASLTRLDHLRHEIHDQAVSRPIVG